MRDHIVLYSVLRKYFIETRRYILNMTMSIAGFLMLFLIVFFGLQSFGAEAETLKGSLVGFAMWIFAASAYSELSWNLIEEARNGTLEQLYLTPSSFRRISGYLVTSSFLFQFIMFAVFLGAMLLITGQRLALNPGVIVLIGLTLLSVYGLGYIMGGLSLVFKKVQAGNQILQFMFILFLVLPSFTDHPIIYFAPISWGNVLINRMMVGGVSLLDISMSNFLILAVNSLIYLLIGLAVFTYLEKVAKKRGLLGHY